MPIRPWMFYDVPARSVARITGSFSNTVKQRRRDTYSHLLTVGNGLPHCSLDVWGKLFDYCILIILAVSLVWGFPQCFPHLGCQAGHYPSKHRLFLLPMQQMLSMCLGSCKESHPSCPQPNKETEWQGETHGSCFFNSFRRYRPKTENHGPKLGAQARFFFGLS